MKNNAAPESNPKHNRLWILTLIYSCCICGGESAIGQEIVVQLRLNYGVLANAEPSLLALA